MDNDMYSLRVLAKGQVSDLSKGFNLGGKPFSVYVRSKSATEMATDTLLNCKLICDTSFGNIPVLDTSGYSGDCPKRYRLAEV